MFNANDRFWDIRLYEKHRCRESACCQTGKGSPCYFVYIIDIYTGSGFYSCYEEDSDIEKTDMICH